MAYRPSSFLDSNLAGPSSNHIFRNSQYNWSHLQKESHGSQNCYPKSIYKPSLNIKPQATGVNSQGLPSNTMHHYSSAMFLSKRLDKPMPTMASTSHFTSGLQKENKPTNVSQTIAKAMVDSGGTSHWNSSVVGRQRAASVQGSKQTHHQQPTFQKRNDQPQVTTDMRHSVSKASTTTGASLLLNSVKRDIGSKTCSQSAKQLNKGVENASHRDTNDRQVPRDLRSVNYQVTCSGEKAKGVVEAFGICTTQGIVKNYNEDGVSIIMNVVQEDKQGVHKPTQAKHNFSYFSVFDGHGGNACVNYLKDNLHYKILNDPLFPGRCDQAIFNGVLKAEKEFLEQAGKNADSLDKSGACCLVALFKDNDCFIGNVGDCRAVMSSHHGRGHKQLTMDHKPETPQETERIKRAGGFIYKKSVKAGDTFITGPCRIVPGKLSVARTIGDIKAKQPVYGGNPRVIIPDADVYYEKIDAANDFIIMCSDGVFDKLSTSDVLEIAWSAIKRHQNTSGDIHFLCKKAAEAVVMAAMESKSNDNLTCLLLALPGLFSYLKPYN